MKTLERLMIAATALLLAGTAVAQTTTTTTRTDEGASSYAVTRMTGEVIVVDGNDLLVRTSPGGEYRWFSPGPDRQFIIDGQPKTVAQLAPGTTLAATVVTRVAPVTVRTISITNGTIVHVQGRSVSARLENGEVRSFRVPANFMFGVDGKQIPVSELKKGMKATATKVVTEPVTELSTLMTVTGKAPK
jgi:hypothetical protein